MMLSRGERISGAANMVVLAVVFMFTTVMAHAKESILYGGGPLYHDAAEHRDMLRASGFTALVIWTIHVYWDGDLVLNGDKIIDDGVYVGRSAWPSEVAAFKSGPTSVGRIEIAVGSWGVPDFENIESLIDSQGTGTNSVLYRNFKALRDAVPAIDAVSFDDESNYDVDSSVSFAVMLNDLGYKVSLCPYTNPFYWISVYNQVQNQRPGSIDRIDLQCYAGGAGNDPGQWNLYFGGLRVTPGLWNYPKTGRQPHHVENQFRYWNEQSEIAGGFMWLLDDMLPVQDEFPVSSWATAINNALDINIPAPPANTDPANLITANAGFEYGPYGWFTVGGDIDSTQASEGSQSARLVSSGAGNPGEWRSAYGNLTTGEIYRLTLDYRTASEATGSPQVHFRFYGEGELKREVQRAVDVTDDAWQSVAIDLQCPADAEYVEVVFSASSYGEFSGTVWLDNVAVHPLNTSVFVVGEWNFDEGTLANTGTSGSTHDAVASGSVSYTSSPLFGGSGQALDVSSGALIIKNTDSDVAGYASTLDLNKFSITMWARLDASTGNAAYTARKGYTGTVGWGFRRNNGGTVNQIQGAAGNGSQLYQDVYDGQWHFLALTVDGGNGAGADTLSFYIDGQLKTQTAITYTGNPADYLRFGEHTGLLDEVKIYNGVLSASEIDGVRFTNDLIPEPARIGMLALEGNQVTIHFDVLTGFDYYVEYRDDLVGPPEWQPLPGAPHNGGQAADILEESVTGRFYRLRRE